MPEGNNTRLMGSLAELAKSQGVMVFKATLDYARKGIPINLEAFTPPWTIIQPQDERGVYVFDKDTTYRQHCSLRDVQDHDGQHICTLSTTDRGVVLPRNAFASRPPDQIFFNQKVGVSRIMYLWLRGLSFIPVNQGGWYRKTVTEGEPLAVLPLNRVHLPF